MAVGLLGPLRSGLGRWLLLSPLQVTQDSLLSQTASKYWTLAL